MGYRDSVSSLKRKYEGKLSLVQQPAFDIWAKDANQFYRNQVWFGSTNADMLMKKIDKFAKED